MLTVWNTDRTFQSVGGTYDDLIVIVCPPGVQLFISELTAWDVTNNATSIGFLIGVADNLQEVYFSTSANAGIRVTHSEPAIILNPGDKLVVRYTGATSADVLRCVGRGEYKQILGGRRG